MAGFVYIMSNPAFPNLLKIGKSTRDPRTYRVNELYQTGLPEPFKVEYYALVEDEDYLEQAVHAKLDQKRPNKNREFFEIDCLEAIDVIRELSIVRSKIEHEKVFYKTPQELAKRRWEEQKIQQVEDDLREHERQLQLAEQARLREQAIIEAQELAKEARKAELNRYLDNEKQKAHTVKVMLYSMGVMLVLLILGSLSA